MKARKALSLDNLVFELNRFLDMITDDNFFYAASKTDRHFLCDTVLEYQLRHKELTGNFYYRKV